MRCSDNIEQSIKPGGHVGGIPNVQKVS